jgi:hypothetical protein
MLAIAESRRGNHKQAKQYLDLARELQPECFLLARAERAFNEACAQAA